MADRPLRRWVLTGCRRNEIAALKWSEIDFEHGCLQLAQTKTGKSTRPLGVAAIAVLQKITREDDSEYVFPPETGDGFFQAYKTSWKRAIEKAALPGVSPQTLRHTMGSTTVSTGEAFVFAGALPMCSMNRRGRSRIESAAGLRPRLPE